MKVSIITPCYNSANTIEETVQSIQKQTYNNIEHIVVDGNSKDRTLEVLDRYKSGINKLISENDDGIYNAINKGIKQSTGDVIGILNADDKYVSNDVIKKVVKEFKDNKIQALYGDLQYLKPKGKGIVRHWKAGEFSVKKFKKGWMPPHPTFFVRSEMYKKYGLYKESYSISADYDLILRFLYKNKISVAYIPEILVQMRAGGISNNGITSRIKAFIEDYTVWIDNDLDKISGIKAQTLKRYYKVSQFS